MNLIDVLVDIAKNDWDCYQFTKKTIRNQDYNTYLALKDIFRQLNRKYGPADEYFDVA